MSAGTLTLTNNSSAVAGSGTAFTTEVATGDFIVVTVGGVPYTLPVKSVESGTALTLVSNFTGPTQAGAAWSAVPRVALNMVTAALVAQSAEALRGLNYDKQNWQQVYSTSGNITVRLPDGSTYTGPSWKYLSDNMATKTGGAVPVNQGGTGGTTPQSARTNLELGNSATRDIGNDSGTVCAGDDGRLNTVDQKTGGVIDGDVELVNNHGARLRITATEGRGSFLQFQDGPNIMGMLYTQSLGEMVIASNYWVTPRYFLFGKDGNATAPGSWTNNSDQRLKKNIKRIEDPLNKMRRIKGCTWDRLDGMGPGIGFIAQEVQDVFPQAVLIGGDSILTDGTVVDNTLSIDISGVSSALHHEAILALMGKIEELTEKVEGLRNGN
ncbi:tail fiber domain-containing protein [Citrobacter freundii]|uniref:tail fiber domain-containing protein n=1 Tax=Citrobacter freundii TaxID=546 RepID=UPI0029DB6030|nr:tail fiber domain-containing protein [Citrobacter freundii]MDX7141568.1 tail fiber domain-containing protein [Citrobacter freundii]